MTSRILSGSTETAESREDNIEYEVLSIPSEVEIDLVSYGGRSDLTPVNAFPVHHFYIRCNDLKNNLRLPLDANPRRPTDSNQVGEMQNTLGREPSNFVKKNNGMTLLCESIQIDQGKQTTTLSFSEGEGICNGGHTYFAIQDYEHSIPDDATVHLEVIEIPNTLNGDNRKQELASISRARNNNNQLEPRSEAEFNNLFNEYKQAMADSNLVAWREGDTEAYFDALDAEDFIRMISIMDPESFKHPIYCLGCETHKTAATRVGSIFDNWMDDAKKARANNSIYPLENIIPLVNDFMYIRDMISYSLKHDRLVDDTGGTSTKIRQLAIWQNWIDKGERKLRVGKYSGETGLNVPKPFEVMVLGLFRSDIALLADDTGVPHLVGWFMEPDQLWDDQKETLTVKYNTYFDEEDKDPNVFKRRTPPFELDFFSLGTGQSEPDPEILYKKDTRERFEQNSSDFTHWLSDENELIDTNKKQSPKDATTYKQHNVW